MPTHMRQLQQISLRQNLILVFFLLPVICIGQRISVEQANKKLSEVFQTGKKKTEILLLGVFHFSYPDLDIYKTPDSLRIDILSNERQAEVAELVNLLDKFKPTKIAIEAMPDKQAYYDSIYSKFLHQQLQNQRDERIQIGFNLAAKLHHEKLYCIDAKPFVKTLWETDSLLAAKYNLDSDKIYEALSSKYEQFYKYDDTLQKSMVLKDYLALINSDNYLQYDNGQYLTYTRAGTNLEPFGADGFISKWFNRNVRIFSNIQRLADNKNDRILVIFGGGHIPILKFLIKSSQEFELRNLNEFIH